MEGTRRPERTREEADRAGPQPDHGSRGGPSESGDPDASRVRWAFLAEASGRLADSIDYETTLATVAGLTLPLLGSWSIVDLAEAGDSVRRLAIVHPDPEKQVVARELEAGWPPWDDRTAIDAVAQTGTSKLVTEVTDDFLASGVRGEETLRRLRSLGIRSLITVPIRARGRTLGAMTFVASAEGRAFTRADLSLAEDLAGRCGLAIDNARLHQAAQVLAATERARFQAEAASRIKTEFLAIISHELRTPLNVMAGYLELLAMEVTGPLTAGQRKYVERVQSGEEQLLRIVEEMLNFARLDAREIQYDFADVALHPIIENVANSNRTDFEEKGLELRTRCDMDVRARTDPAKVWQILMNLLSNARKFTDPGGTVTMACRMDDARPSIQVIDTGCGIPADKLESVFEPFVQADGSLTRPAEGMGLGLPISRQLARDMDGDLTVSSEAGHGCTFVLLLAPVQED